LVPPYRLRDGGLSLAVRVTPRARRDAIDGLRDTADGPALAVAIKAPAEGGKANAAVAALLAEALGLPKSAVTLAQGGKSRLKTFHIAGPERALAARLDILTAGETHG
jgi:uncharacterized protein (TIGR00251 family)